MADEIALSACIEEIETRLEQNRVADALALCKHILRYYPKHLETYGLVARTLALQHDWDGALDVFRRVLSADPENADAYVGIAKLFADRRQLNEAAWHMERAYELAPARADIRQELLRLLAQLEGSPRDRLKLTRSALARLYVQEGLFAQAIRELREISAATPSRFDTRVALAETLWQAGQARQAAETAQALLDPLPYCLKANLILGAAWHESQISESEAFLLRAQALDPSNLVADKMLGERSPLRPVQVKIPKPLDDYRPPRLGVNPSAPVAFESSPKTNIPLSATSEPAAELPSVPPVLETREEAGTSKAEQVVVPQEAIEPKPSVSSDLVPTLGADSIPEAASAELPEPLPELAEGPLDWLSELKKSFGVGSAEEPPVETPSLPALGVEGEPVASEPMLPLPTEEPAATSAISATEESAASEPMPQLPAEELTPAPAISTAEESAASEPVPQLPAEEPPPAPAISTAEESAASEPVPPLLTEEPAAASVISATEELAASEPMPTSAISSEESTTTSEPIPQLPAEEPAPAPVISPEETIASEPMPQLPAEEPTTPALAIFAEEEPSAEQMPRERIVPSWLGDVSQEEIAQEKPPQEEELPEWLRTQQAESRRGDVPEPIKMPKWVEVLSQPPTAEAGAATPIASQPTPESASHDIVETGQETPAPLLPPGPEVTQLEPSVQSAESTTAQESDATPSQSERQPRYYPRLVQAREYRDANRWSDAFAEYEFVIHKAPGLVNEVIQDLETIVAGGDAPLDVHRLLGDAYTCAGRLSDALERYRFVYRRVSE